MAIKRKTNDQRIAEYQAKIKRLEVKKQIETLRQQLKKKV
jgi:hypothetical protein